jgi:hypothetical protein
MLRAALARSNAATASALRCSTPSAMPCAKCTTPSSPSRTPPSRRAATRSASIRRSYDRGASGRKASTMLGGSRNNGPSPRPACINGSLLSIASTTATAPTSRTAYHPPSIVTTLLSSTSLNQWINDAPLTANAAARATPSGKLALIVSSTRGTDAGPRNASDLPPNARLREPMPSLSRDTGQHRASLQPHPLHHRRDAVARDHEQHAPTSRRVGRVPRCPDRVSGATLRWFGSLLWVIDIGRSVTRWIVAPNGRPCTPNENSRASCREPWQRLLFVGPVYCAATVPAGGGHHRDRAIAPHRAGSPSRS